MIDDTSGCSLVYVFLVTLNLVLVRQVNSDRNLMMERWQRWDRRALVGILSTDHMLWCWNYPMILFYPVPLKRCDMLIIDHR